MSDEKKSGAIPVQDMGLRYDNRILKIEILVNTDSDHHKIAKALYSRARGPRLDAAVISISVYDGEDGKEIWNDVQQAIRSGISKPGFGDNEDVKG